MKRKKSLALLPFVAAGFNFICGCTSNPFGDNEISEEKRKISGVVQLADQSSAKGVVVWMSGFNITTLADESGRFEITLPSKERQGATGGLSGIFSMYFFVANYLLDSAQVVVQNGAFVYGRGDVNKDGKMSAPRSLRRFLRISTALLPPSVEKNFANRIGVNVTLQTIMNNDTATVIFPRSVGGFLGAVFFKRAGSDDLIIYEQVVGADTRDIVVVGKASSSRLAVFTLQQLLLPPGQYEVIPYLLIRHQRLPPGLLASLGAVESLSPAYLNLPFRREGGQFEVQQ